MTVAVLSGQLLIGWPPWAQEANVLAGEEILFHNDKKRSRRGRWRTPHDKKIIAPVF